MFLGLTTEHFRYRSVYLNAFQTCKVTQEKMFQAERMGEVKQFFLESQKKINMTSWHFQWITFDRKEVWSFGRVIPPSSFERYYAYFLLIFTVLSLKLSARLSNTISQVWFVREIFKFPYFTPYPGIAAWCVVGINFPCF